MGRLERRLSAYLKRERGLESYAQFARRCGVPKSTIYAAENGYAAIKLDTLEQIMKKLNVSMIEIFGDDASMPPKRER